MASEWCCNPCRSELMEFDKRDVDEFDVWIASFLKYGGIRDSKLSDCGSYKSFLPSRGTSHFNSSPDDIVEYFPY